MSQLQRRTYWDGSTHGLAWRTCWGGPGVTREAEQLAFEVQRNVHLLPPPARFFTLQWLGFLGSQAERSARLLVIDEVLEACGSPPLLEPTRCALHGWCEFGQHDDESLERAAGWFARWRGTRSSAGEPSRRAGVTQWVGDDLGAPCPPGCAGRLRGLPEPSSGGRLPPQFRRRSRSVGTCADQDGESRHGPRSWSDFSRRCIPAPSTSRWSTHVPSTCNSLGRRLLRIHVAERGSTMTREEIIAFALEHLRRRRDEISAEV